MFTIIFSAAQINAFRIEQVVRENDTRTSIYAQLVSSKHFVACNARVQCSGCGLKYAREAKEMSERDSVAFWT